MDTQVYGAANYFPSLIVLENHQVNSYQLAEKAKWKVGRVTPENSADIPLQSSIASRSHGELVYVNSEWCYIDYGSINGTYLNGKKIENQKNEKSKLYALKSGDVLRIDSEDLSDNRGVWMMFLTEFNGYTWQSFSLEEKRDVYIGSNAQVSDIVFPFQYISEQHTCVGYGNGHYFVMDCNSYYGTYLNGMRLEHGQVLRESDRITLCDRILIFTGNELIFNVN